MKLEAGVISMGEKLACVERELKMRRKVYPRRVEIGWMKEKEADREIEIMQAIVEDYMALTAKDRLL